MKFDSEGIAENIRRAAETAHILNQAGLIAICSFISPLSRLRAQAREIIGKDRFVELFLDAPLEWVEARDQTGLYAKARSGEVTNLAGVNAPYEKPRMPEIHLPIDRVDFDEVVDRMIAFLASREIIQVDDHS